MSTASRQKEERLSEMELSSPLPLLVVAKRENPLPPPFLCAKKRVPELGLLSLRLLRWRPASALRRRGGLALYTHSRSLGRDTSLRGAGSFLSSLLSLRGAWPDRPPPSPLPSFSWG